MRNTTCTDFRHRAPAPGWGKAAARGARPPRGRAPLAAALALMATGAAAAPMPTGCYARAYSDTHLAANPGQTVAQIVVGLSDVSPGGGFIGTAVLRARMAATATTTSAGTANRWFDTYVYCEIPGGTGWPDWVDPARVTCFAECDGGYFQVLRATGSDLLIRTEYLTLSGEACGGGASLGDEGAETTTYKLHAAPKEACAP